MSANICPNCHTQHDTTACPAPLHTPHLTGVEEWEQSIRADERAKVLAELREKGRRRVANHIAVRDHGDKTTMPCEQCYYEADSILAALLGEQKGEKKDANGTSRI